jgi:predicted nucleic acid-binding Zn ribbon protein
MDDDRKREYLERFLQSKNASGLKPLIPVVSRWNEILGSVPGLRKQNPGSHCRLSQLKDGLLTVEADHPAWLQLLQWHQGEILDRVRAAFPSLGIRSLQLRLIRAGETVERPNVVMPEPVKPELSGEEQEQMDEILAQLDAMIHKKG